MVIDDKELEKFLDYVIDKVEDCYKSEVSYAIKLLLKKE